MREWFVLRRASAGSQEPLHLFFTACAEESTKG
jgi:hypothetical protein